MLSGEVSDGIEVDLLDPYSLKLGEEGGQLRVEWIILHPRRAEAEALGVVLPRGVA